MFARGVLVAFLMSGGAAAQENPRPLVEALSSDRIEEREEAALRLQTLGSRAVPALEEGARSADVEIRQKCRKLLHDVEAPSALIEDLRSDDIPGNAKHARAMLLRRYDSRIRALLLEAVKSDDLQQSVQVGFILAVQGDAEAALRAEPDLFVRAAGVFVRNDADGFPWVAAHLLVRLEQVATPSQTEKAYGKVLKGLPPTSLGGAVLEMAETCGRLKRPFPAPLLRRYLLNFRDDTAFNNATTAARVAGMLGEMAVPALEELLGSTDAQARHLAMRLLLNFQRKNLPPSAPAVLGEMIGREPRALPRLLSFGPAAMPVLEERIESADAPTALAAARGLAELDRARWAARAARIAVSNLETDNFETNAQEAAKFLVRLGDDALPVLREALDSDDEQVVVSAAAVLAALGRPPAPKGRVLDAAFRLAVRTWGHDERECLTEALATVDGLKEVVSERLRKSGAEGTKRAAECDVRLAQSKYKPWLAPDSSVPQVAEGR